MCSPVVHLELYQHDAEVLTESMRAHYQAESDIRNRKFESDGHSKFGEIS